jgi:hypothetical protein
MPDTRKSFPVGSSIPGFNLGGGQFNQALHPAAQQIGTFRWRPHVTVDPLSNPGRKVEKFHVSLYVDGENYNWGVFKWVYSSGANAYASTGFARVGAQNLLVTARALETSTNLAVRTAFFPALLARVTAIAQAQLNVFGVSSTTSVPPPIANAAWGFAIVL